MSSNVGLSTPRGSGTSGYVQRNLSHLKPRDNPYPRDAKDEVRKHHQRKPDAGILEHERRREVEVKVFELRDKLEDEGVDEEEIEERTDALRKQLLSQQKDGKAPARGLKSHQVHELAEAKIQETEKLRRALGISKDYEEGSYWKRQEEKEHEKQQMALEKQAAEQLEAIDVAAKEKADKKRSSRSRSSSFTGSTASYSSRDE